MAEDELQDAAVLVVEDFVRRIDPDIRAKLDGLAMAAGDHLDLSRPGEAARESSGTPRMSKTSSPVRPRESRFRRRGLERHDAHADQVGAVDALVELSAMTAVIPSKRGPLAAQSREEPEPYSLPARTTSGTPSARYFSDASKIDITAPSGEVSVTPPSVPGAMRFLRRTLANVPRTMTS